MGMQIKHFVTLCLENRSFDYILTDCPKLAPRPLYSMCDSQGNVFWQKAQTDLREVIFDIPHDEYSIAKQVSNGGTGFITALEEHEAKYHKEDVMTNHRKQQVMYYLPWGSMPAFHNLFETGLLLNNYHASILSSTIPNRYFLFSGTNDGLNFTPEDEVDVNVHFDQHIMQAPTIFQTLESRNIDWRVFYHDLPTTSFLPSMWEQNMLQKQKPFTEFATYCTLPEEEFPVYTHIEPRYSTEYANDFHLSHVPSNTDTLIADVYNALRKNEELFNKTLLLITTDEHGGFANTYTPKRAVNPDPTRLRGSIYEHYGVQVPAVLVNPYLTPTMSNVLYDHTSVIKTVLDLCKLPYDLHGERVKHANSFLKEVKSRHWSTPERLQRLQEVPQPKSARGDVLTNAILRAGSQAIRLANLTGKVIEEFSDLVKHFELHRCSSQPVTRLSMKS